MKNIETVYVALHLGDKDANSSAIASILNEEYGPIIINEVSVENGALPFKVFCPFIEMISNNFCDSKIEVFVSTEDVLLHRAMELQLQNRNLDEAKAAKVNLIRTFSKSAYKIDDLIMFKANYNYAENGASAVRIENDSNFVFKRLNIFA